MRSRLPLGEKLRDELGAPRRGRRLGSSPRSRVWRAELAGTPVVVKQLVDAPEADERYAREVAALRLAGRVDPRVVPTLLGTDARERVLVLEYVEHRPPREEWIVDYAGALARLHAATSGAADDGDGSDGDGDGSDGSDGSDGLGVLAAWSGPAQADVGSFLTLAQALGVAVPPAVRGELDDLVDRTSQARGRALLHGDPCPGNDMHTDDGVRFIDFEQAALGDGIVELAYLRVGFPTCWCVTAPAHPLLEAAEATYRDAWRRATGTDVQGDLTDACAGWLLRGDALVQRAERGATDHLARIPHQDWEWGTVTARQRLVHRLGVVGRMTAQEGRLPALGHLAPAMREAMLTRWPTLQPPPARRT
ncbi:aminoglycoside phosphotransferase family protein [Streptomyces sp. CBMA29]|uniref:aminoglycoside phosphotransferase family protein n=1 Tax=Streptomyces sp. CBMA29 TaxID=1896314 RepID=UPI0016620EBC|nr:aminoglycoside phosphotransferase family protein [Streptomyces sp. CBMA29]MBD0738095.1 aminoglycoside phosphotransferase [Streptomyces sp. CBMA29]